jgi:aspartate-semialdehyde dehydrogenase
MPARLDVAVIGAAGATGAAMLDQLLARDFPLGQVHALDVGAAAGGMVAFGHRELAVSDVAAFDFARVRLALFAVDADAARQWIPVASAAGSWAVDSSSAYRGTDGVALLAPDLNPEALAACRERRIVALADPGAAVLALILRPIQRAAGLRQVDVFSCHPVSEIGAGAAEELGRQTADLLSFREIRSEAFSRQIAFNLLPEVGAGEADGGNSSERRMATDAAQLLGQPALPINVTAIRVPVFYGQSLAIHVQTDSVLTVAEARALLAPVPGLSLAEEHPTPVTEASGNEAVHVGRLRQSRGACGLNLWAVLDNIRRGSALQAVQTAEIILRDYL